MNPFFRVTCPTFVAVVCFALLYVSETAQAQVQGRGALADKPLFRDPVFDGAADPVLTWDFRSRHWYMFYTNRRAKLPEDQVDGVNWVHGTKIGIARSRDGAKWEYVGTAKFDQTEEDVTFWAPDVVFADGKYHMYVTLVPGVFRDWQHPRSITHYTSRDLQNWEYQSTLPLASEKVIDASVMRLPDGTWRMWYNNEADKKSIWYADSPDLNQWTDQGKAKLAGGNRGEGPKVFRFGDWYWLVMDTWDGLAVYRSKDATEWQRQPQNLLREAGTGADDQVKGQHPDVLVFGRRAYLFYFTHPGRTSDDVGGYEARRSSIQVTELTLADDWLTCDRDAPTHIDLRFRFRTRVHDPSTILKQNDRYWLFSTGYGVQALCSDDLKNWRRMPPLIRDLPEWVRKVVPTQRGHFWAPDVIKHGDRYLVYYSVSAFGKRTSAIALASSPTLDPNDSDYQWTDHGIVIQTDESDNYNAIDPGIVQTPEGELWMVFGSFWSGIKLIQLDPQTGLRIAPDSPVHSLASKNEIEAPAILFRDGYYYLFLNWGLCCRGVQSTYNIRVGRSREITGPYLDRDGKDMREGGGTLVLGSEGSAIGPGHPGFFEYDGQQMFSYHFYSAENRGRPTLGIRSLSWDEDGWPQVGSSLSFEGNVLRSED